MVAREIPCDTLANPEVCAFLNRYLIEITQWNNKEVSVRQKMRDDKFLILEGNIHNLSFDSTTAVSIKRFEHKAYEVVWTEDDSVLLRVAFPIQYELILGQSQIELEPQLQQLIMNAKPFSRFVLPDLAKVVNEKGIYCSPPSTFYEVPALTNRTYYVQHNDSIRPLMDSAFVEYSLSNLFSIPIDGIDMQVQVRQSIYGFKQLNYTISLRQWINYCYAEELTPYVAIEEESEVAWKMLIIAENKDLAYNHILSVLVPKNLFSSKDVTLYAKVHAFVPTHNIKDLYEQYRQQTKKHTYE